MNFKEMVYKVNEKEKDIIKACNEWFPDALESNYFNDFIVKSIKEHIVKSKIKKILESKRNVNKLKDLYKLVKRGIQMQKLIIFTEKEFVEVEKEFAINLNKLSGLNSGCCLINNKTGKKIKGIDNIMIALSEAWENIFDE